MKVQRPACDVCYQSRCTNCVVLKVVTRGASRDDSDTSALHTMPPSSGVLLAEGCKNALSSRRALPEYRAAPVAAC